LGPRDGLGRVESKAVLVSDDDDDKVIIIIIK
jgi:hypothetical protein